jgi:hypothetical protein
MDFEKFNSIECPSIIVAQSSKFEDGQIFLFAFIYKNEDSILKKELLIFLKKQIKSNQNLISSVFRFSVILGFTYLRLVFPLEKRFPENLKSIPIAQTVLKSDYFPQQKNYSIDSLVLIVESYVPTSKMSGTVSSNSTMGLPASITNGIISSNTIIGLPAATTSASTTRTDRGQSSITFTTRKGYGLSKSKSSNQMLKELFSKGTFGSSRLGQNLKSSALNLEGDSPRYKFEFKSSIDAEDRKLRKKMEKVYASQMRTQKPIKMPENILQGYLDKKSQELGRPISVHLLSPEQIGEFKEIIREKLSSSAEFRSLRDSVECINGVTRTVTGDEKRQLNVDSAFNYQIMSFESVPKIEENIKKMQKNLLDLYRNEIDFDRYIRTREEIHQVLTNLTVEEMPILALLTPNARPKASYFYFIKRCTINCYPPDARPLLDIQVAHILAKKAFGVNHELNLVSLHGLNHGYATELESILSPDTALSGSGRTVFNTAMGKIDVFDEAVEISIKAHLDSATINQQLRPIKQSFEELSFTQDGDCTKAFKLIEQCTKMPSKNPFFIEKNVELLSHMSNVTGSKVGAGLGFFLAYQNNPNCDSATLTAAGCLGSHIGGKLFTYSSVTTYLQNLQNLPESQIFSPFLLLEFGLYFSKTIFFDFTKPFQNFEISSVFTPVITTFVKNNLGGVSVFQIYFSLLHSLVNFSLSKNPLLSQLCQFVFFTIFKNVRW